MKVRTLHHKWHYTCLCNIVEVIVDQAPKSAAAGKPEAAAAFVLRQYRRMPDLYRLPVYLLSLFFNLAAVFRYGKTFNALPRQKRRAWFASWKNSPIGLVASFARFYESLALLHLYGG